MGSSNSINIDKEQFSQYELGIVRKSHYKKGNLLKLYCRPDRDIFTIPLEDKPIKFKNDEPICKSEISRKIYSPIYVLSTC